MQATREALIAAGLALFGEQGLDAPSLDAICERAGFTRGAFYVHFADRDAFLVAVMDRVGKGVLDAILGPSHDGAASGPPSRRAREASPRARSPAGPKEDLDLTAVAMRFLGAVAQGRYPLMRSSGVKPRQLLDACSRSELIRGRYVGLVTDSIDRLAGLIGAGQERGTLRSDVGAREAAIILLTAVLGAQTMMELGVAFDLPGAAEGLLRLLSRTESAAK